VSDKLLAEARKKERRRIIRIIIRNGANTICLPIFGFLSSNFMKICRNIHCSVWQLLEVEKKFKMMWMLFLSRFINFCSASNPL
jgi:hypothetical protein